MAIQLMPIKVSILAVDDDGATSTHSVYVAAATDFVAVKNFAAAFLALVAAISDGAITGYNITQTAYDDTFPEGPAGSDVEDKGVFLCKTADNHRSALALPSIDEAVLVTEGALKGIQIDLTDADVAAYVVALIDGLEVLDSQSNPVTVQPQDRRGSDLDALVDAYKQNRPSFRSRKRRG